MQSGETKTPAVRVSIDSTAQVIDLNAASGSMELGAKSSRHCNGVLAGGTVIPMLPKIGPGLSARNNAHGVSILRNRDWVIAKKFLFISLGAQANLADYIHSHFARAAGLHINGPEVNIDDQFPSTGRNGEVFVKLFVGISKDNEATTQEDNKRCFHTRRSITRSNERKFQARVITKKTGKAKGAETPEWMKIAFCF
jgi:hypothetical protein